MSKQSTQQVSGEPRTSQDKTQEQGGVSQSSLRQHTDVKTATESAAEVVVAMQDTNVDGAKPSQPQSVGQESLHIQTQKSDVLASEGAQFGGVISEDEEDLDSEDSLTFSNGVIEKIVALAMRDVPGVIGMKGTWFNRVQETFGTKDSRKGVNVEVTPEASVRVNISVLIEYGAYAPQVFEDVKRAVVKSVVGMTGLSVAGVNLRIEDVLTAEEAAARNKIARSFVDADNQEGAAQDASGQIAAAQELPEQDRAAEDSSLPHLPTRADISTGAFADRNQAASDLSSYYNGSNASADSLINGSSKED